MYPVRKHMAQIQNISEFETKDFLQMILGIKVAQSDGNFNTRLSFFGINVLCCLTLVSSHFYFKWLNFQIFEVLTYQINLGMYAKTLTPEASAVTGEMG